MRHIARGLSTSAGRTLGSEYERRVGRHMSHHDAICPTQLHARARERKRGPRHRPKTPCCPRVSGTFRAARVVHAAKPRGGSGLRTTPTLQHGSGSGDPFKSPSTPMSATVRQAPVSHRPNSNQRPASDSVLWNWSNPKKALARRPCPLKRPNRDRELNPLRKLKS